MAFWNSVLHFKIYIYLYRKRTQRNLKKNANVKNVYWKNETHQPTCFRRAITTSVMKLPETAAHRVRMIQPNVAHLRSPVRNGPKTATSPLTINVMMADIRQELTEVSIDCSRVFLYEFTF